MKDFFRLFKVNKLKAFIILITFIINTVATGYLLYAISLLNGIENKVRLLLAIVLGIAWIIFVICYRKSIKKGDTMTVNKFIKILNEQLLDTINESAFDHRLRYKSVGIDILDETSIKIQWESYESSYETDAFFEEIDNTCTKLAEKYLLEDNLNVYTHLTSRDGYLDITEHTVIYLDRPTANLKVYNIEYGRTVRYDISDWLIGISIKDLKIGKYETSRTDQNTGTAIILNIPDSDLEENMKSMRLRQTKKPLVCKCYKLKEHKYNGHDIYLNKEKMDKYDTYYLSKLFECE